MSVENVIKEDAKCICCGVEFPVYASYQKRSQYNDAYDDLCRYMETAKCKDCSK